MDARNPIEPELGQERPEGYIVWALAVLLAVRLIPLLVKALAAPGAKLFVLMTLIWAITSVGGPLLLRRWVPGVAGFAIRPWFKLPRDIIGTVGLSVLLVSWHMTSCWVMRKVGVESGRIYAPWDISLEPAFVGRIVGFWIPVLVCPIAEEIFWRAFCLSQLEKLLSKGQALLVASLMFGVYHFQVPGFTVTLVGCGLILGAWRQKMETLFPPMVAHMVVNALVVGLQGIS